MPMIADNPKLKIAQLTSYYYPAISGVEAVCRGVSEELVRRGHEVHIFTSDRIPGRPPGERPPSVENINGVVVHRFKCYASAGHHGFFPGFIEPLANGGFDVIHSHGLRQPQSIMSAWIGARRNIPSILHVHGGFYSSGKLKRLAYDFHDRFARKGRVSRFDHFIVLSEAHKQFLLEMNFANERISIIRNAVEAAAFSEYDPLEFRRKNGLSDRKVILYVGRMHRYKRPDLIVSALPELVRTDASVMALFVGPDAGELDTIRNLANSLGVADHCKWLGSLVGKEKHEAYACSEFLALPADEDPYPLVLSEAMAHGKPVLTTDVVGQAPIIEANEAGVVVPPDDLDAVVAGAKRLLTDEAYSKTVGSNGRRLAETAFGAEAIVDEIEDLYLRLIKARSRD